MNNSFLLSPTMASIFFSLKWFVLPNGRRSEESKNRTKKFDEFFFHFSWAKSWQIQRLVKLNQGE